MNRRLIAAVVVTTLVIIIAIVILGLVAMRCDTIETLSLPYQCTPKKFHFESGDILLFSGSGHAGGLMSKLSRLLGHTPYTHVGMVFKAPNTSVDYVWEMRIGAQGTELRPLNLVWDTYPGEISIRPIFRCGRRGGVDSERLRAIIRSMFGLRYKYDFYLSTYNRWFSPLEFPYHRGKGRQTRFCSDLVAETYVRLGILRNDPWRKSYEIVPSDFSEVGVHELPLARGWSFGPEIQLLRTPILAKSE